MKKILRFIKSADLDYLGWFFLGVNVYSATIAPLLIALGIFLVDVAVSIKLMSME
jgi:hypothetical protein